LGAVRDGEVCAIARISGRRGRNRTCNHRIRNPVLYPIELRARRLEAIQPIKNTVFNG
jgi:hypothetical protein